jgi:hypothetical protein
MSHLMRPSLSSYRDDKSKSNHISPKESKKSHKKSSSVVIAQPSKPKQEI